MTESTRSPARLRVVGATAEPDGAPHSLATTNLPPQFTSFVGRDADVRRLRRLLASERLVTLTGPGGIGKTRLAVETARALLGTVDGGVWFVDLSEARRPEQVAAKFASVLGQQEESGRELVESLTELLRHESALIVVDNCEHVLDPAAALIATLLSSCDGLTCLATSRERLGVAGEVVLPLAPLTVPDSDAAVVAETVSDYAAVQLFFERAASAGASLDRLEHSVAVASICRRLDGLPLAIELAAARVNVLTLTQIADRLGDRLNLLVRGPRTAPARQQTLRATVEWSYELLAPPAQVAMRRLSVFGSSFSLESAEEVGSGGTVPQSDVLDLVTTLVEKSLLFVVRSESAGRYRMLETIREFATEMLDQSGEADDVRNRSCEHFAQLAEAAAPQLEGADQPLWLERLERDHDNLRDALTWSSHGGDPAVGLRIAGALWRFWYIRGYFSEGRRWLELLLPLAVAAPAAGRARALRSLAVMLRVQGDYGGARDRLSEALTIYRDLGDDRGSAMTLNSLGIVARAMGDFDESLRLLGGECLALYRSLGDTRGVATALNNMGNAARAKRDHVATKALCLESLALYRVVGFREGEAASLLNLGLTAQATGDHAEARKRYFASLDLYLDLGYREGVAEALEALGMLAGVDGDSTRSARLLGAGERLREVVGAPIPFAHEKAEHDRVVELVRSAAGSAAFAIDWDIGRSLTMEEAVAYAAAENTVVLRGAGRPGGLTRRELEVAALVAIGLKDRDIAQRLSISARTAGKHVEHIRDKLGLRSRNELGAWATRMGVTSTERD